MKHSPCPRFPILVHEVNDLLEAIYPVSGHPNRITVRIVDPDRPAVNYRMVLKLGVVKKTGHHEVSFQGNFVRGSGVMPDALANVLLSRRAGRAFVGTVFYAESVLSHRKRQFEGCIALDA